MRTVGDRVVGVREKPSFPWDVCAGIYVADPMVRKYLPDDAPVDMPALINTLADRGEPVRAHPFSDAWHDVGTPARYEAARDQFVADTQLYLDPRRTRSAAPGEGYADRELT